MTLHRKPVKHVNVNCTDQQVRKYSMKMPSVLSYSPLERWEKERVFCRWWHKDSLTQDSK